MSNVTTCGVVSSQNPSTSGNSVTFTATVTATPQIGTSSPSGNVEFYDGVTLLSAVALTPTAPNAATSTAAYLTSVLSPGSHSITAVYVGDVNYLTSTSAAVVQQVVVTSLLGGFAVQASYVSTGDETLPPNAQLNAVPSSVSSGQSLVLLWTTLNVAKVRIQGTNGVDYLPTGFDTGLLTTSGSGAYSVPSGFTAAITLTLTTYDINDVLLAPTGIAIVTVV